MNQSASQSKCHAVICLRARAREAFSSSAVKLLVVVAGRVHLKTYGLIPGAFRILHIIRLIDITMAGKIEAMLRCTPQQTAGRQQEEFYYDVLILSDRLLSMKASSIRHIQVNVIQSFDNQRSAGEIIPLEEATEGLDFAWLLRRWAMVGVP